MNLKVQLPAKDEEGEKADVAEKEKRSSSSSSSSSSSYSSSSSSSSSSLWWLDLTRLEFQSSFLSWPDWPAELGQEDDDDQAPVDVGDCKEKSKREELSSSSADASILKKKKNLNDDEEPGDEDDDDDDANGAKEKIIGVCVYPGYALRFG